MIKDKHNRRGKRLTVSGASAYPPIRATARLLKWPLDVMPNCVICIRLPAVAGVPVIGMLEMAGVLGGIGAPVGWCCWTAIRG
jgi:hypothetical protein